MLLKLYVEESNFTYRLAWGIICEIVTFSQQTLLLIEKGLNFEPLECAIFPTIYIFLHGLQNRFCTQPLLKKDHFILCKWVWDLLPGVLWTIFWRESVGMDVFKHVK